MISCLPCIPAQNQPDVQDRGARRMDVDDLRLTDFDGCIALVREVEPLFGPMADEVDFQNALKKAISNNAAFCIRSAQNEMDKTLKGGIVISKESNAIAWFAVSRRCRGMGYGRQLLTYAIGKLNTRKSIFVRTFDESVSEGKAARKLYSDFGFADYRDGGFNPAGVPTVIMQKQVETAEWKY